MTNKRKPSSNAHQAQISPSSPPPPPPTATVKLSETSTSALVSKMPAPTAPSPNPPFSYEGSAKSLRNAQTPTSQKLAICRQLLAHSSTLTPPPTALVLSHITYTISQRDPPPPYYALLHDLLAQTQTPFPSTLLHRLTPHISPHLSYILPLLPPISSALSRAPLKTQTDFLVALLSHAPPSPLVHSIVQKHIRYLSQLRDVNAALNAAAALLPPVLSNKAFHVHFRALRTPLFPASAARSSLPFLVAIRATKSDMWPFAVVELLKASSTAVEMKVKKRQRGEQDKHVLRFLDELLALLMQLAEEDGCALQAIVELLQVAAGLGVYRPGEGVRKKGALEKRAEVLAKMTWRDPDVASRLRSMMSALTKMMVEGMGDTRAVCAVVKFSLDDVEDLVPEALASCRRGSRAVLVETLITEFGKRRKLPALFAGLRASRYGVRLVRMYADVWGDERIREVLAEAVYALPRGHGVECVHALMGEGDVDDVAVCMMLGAMVLEASRGEGREVFENICAHLGNVEGTSEGLRCAALFLAASGWLVDARGGEVEVGARLLGMGGVVVLGDGVGEIVKAVRDCVREGAGAGKMFCVTRLLAVLVHRCVERGEFVEIVVEAMFKIFKRMSGLKDVENEWIGLMLGGKLFEHVVRMVASTSQAWAQWSQTRDLPSGFEKFVAAAIAMVGGEAMWDELVESRHVQRVFPSAFEQALGQAVHGDGGCGKVRLLRLLQSLPELHIADTADSGLREKLASDVKGRMCCEEARVHGAACVVLLPGTTVEELKKILPTLVGKGGGSDVFMSLVRKVGVDLGRKETEELVESAFKLWMEEGRVEAMLRNVKAVFAKQDVTCVIGNAVWSGVVKHMAGIDQACGVCLNANEVSDTARGLNVVCALLGLRIEIERRLKDVNENSEVLLRVRDDASAILGKVFEQSIAKAVQLVEETGVEKSKTSFMTGQQLLITACRGEPPVYRLLLCGEGSLLATKLCAQAMYFLKNEHVLVRTVGMEMFCKLGSYESEVVVKEMANAVLHELESWDDLPPQTCDPNLTMDDASNLLESFKLLRGKVLAGAALLCGCERGSQTSPLRYADDGSFEGFKEVRKRRDLSSVPLDRESTFDLSIALLHVSARVLDTALDLKSRSSQETDMIANELNEINDVAWRCALFALQACQVAVERRASARLVGAQIQELLIELVVMAQATTFMQTAPTDQVTATNTLLAQICRSLVHHHGNSVRWPVTRLLRMLVRYPHLAVETATALGDAYTELAGRQTAGKDLTVRGTLADACDAFTKVGSQGVRRGITPGVAKLIAACGEEGVKQVMAALGVAAKDVLRQFRESYVQDFQYRGK